MTGRGALLGGGLLALAILGGVVLYLDGKTEPPVPGPAAPGAPHAPAPASPSPAAPPPDAPAAPPLEGGPGAVVGRLVRGSPPTPVPGRVTVAGPGGAAAAATVDATGLFRLAGLPAGTPLAFEATSPGLLPHRLPWVRLAAGDPLDLGDLALGAGTAVAVEVADGRGRPISGASVTLRRWPAGAFLGSVPSEYPEDSAVPPSLRASTGAEGRVVLEGTPPGPWRVEVAAAGFAPREESFTVVEGRAAAPLRFLLLPALALAGRVSIFDTPAEGAVVEAVERNFMRRVRSRPADADGGYLLEGLDAGRWTLSVWPTPDTEVCVGGLDLPGLDRFDIRLPAGGRVLGTVLDDATGAPVPGALVTLRTDGAGFLDDSAATRTDPDGRFSLDHLPPDVPNITGFSVTATGFLDFPDGRSEPVVPEAALFPGTADGIVVRLRRGAAVVGRVLDPEGRPVPGARVSLFSSIGGGESGFSTPALADVEGRWRLEPVEPGTGILLVAAPGFCQEEFPADPAAALSTGTAPASWTVEVPASGEARKDLVLSRGGAIEGTVVDADGAPMAGAAISCHPEGRWDELGTAGPSDGEGRFRVAGVPSGRALEVSASLPDRPDGRSEPLTLGPGETKRDLRIVLPAPAALAGILRREDGTPLRAPRLRIVDGEPEDGALDPMILGMAAYRPVAPDGSFRVEGLDAGTWTLAAEDEGCALAVGPVVVLGEGERREELEAILPAGMSIAGRVVDGKGAPLPGAVVLVARVFEKYSTASVLSDLHAPAASAITGEDGAFRKEGLPPGPHSVTVRADGTRERSVETPAGTADLLIVMESGFSVAGRVVDAEDGRPVAGVRVTARPRGPRGFSEARETVSGGNGEFLLDGLPEGGVDLRFDPESGGKVGGYGAKTVRGVAAGTSGLEVALPRGLAIAGRVVDEEGRAIASALVIHAVGRGDDGEILFATVTREGSVDGSFLVGGLLPGTYSLTVSSSPDYLSATERGLRSGTEGVVVVLRRTGRISGRVVDGDGLPVGSGVPVAADFRGAGKEVAGAHGRTETGADGSFSIGMLGPYRFRLTAGGGNRCDFLPSAHPGDVAVGTTDVEIRAARGASLSGMLRDAAGAAVRGVAVRARTGEFVEAWLVSDWQEVDDDGAFHLRGLPPGTVTLEVRAGDGETIPLGEWTAPGENLRVVIPER